MTTFHGKLALSALAIAMLATPALAQGRHHQAPQQQQHELYNSAAEAPSGIGTYPNGAIRSGSVYSRESGADDNLIR